MSHGKHLNEDQRRMILSMLCKKSRLVEIADLLEMEPSSISKELQRNRVLTKNGLKDKACKQTLRFPYVCNACAKKYSICPFTQYKYDPHAAQINADTRLVTSRQGLSMTDEEYRHLDKTIKDGVADKQSIYHIVKHHAELQVSVPTVYRLINTRQLSTKPIDLPYAVKYKKRKSLAIKRAF